MQSILHVSLFIFNGYVNNNKNLVQIYLYTKSHNNIALVLFIVMDSNVSKLNEDPLRWYMYQTTVKLIKDLNKILCIKHE